MAQVSLRNLSKKYGSHLAIPDLNLEIRDKEFVVLVGPSGCGKSTTLRMIAGLEEISGGDLLFDKDRVNDVSPVQRNVAMVFQNYALYPHMTVEKNLSFGLQNLKMPAEDIKSRVAEAAEALGLTPLLQRKPSQLSGGQRQRVAMGRAIVRHPAVFLFDEPLSNLDAKLRGEMRTVIKRLHKTVNTTIVYVTHDQVEAMTLADRIVVMKEGKIEQEGPPQKLFDNPATVFVASFLGSPQANLISGSVAEGGHFRAEKGSFSVALPNWAVGSASVGDLVVLGIRPDDVSPSAKDTVGLVQLPPGKIDVVEPLGAESYLLVKIGDTEILAKSVGRTQHHVGETVQLAVNPETVMLFDKASGQTLKKGIL